MRRRSVRTISSGRESFEAHCRSIYDTWLRFPVGHHFQYSNLGIDLAGYILQRRSGLPFDHFVRRRLFEPLGLRRTTFNAAEIRREKDRAIGHTTGYTHIPVRVPMVAAGGLYTTVDDACRFMQFQLGDPAHLGGDASAAGPRPGVRTRSRDHPRARDPCARAWRWRVRVPVGHLLGARRGDRCRRTDQLDRAPVPVGARCRDLPRGCPAFPSASCPLSPRGVRWVVGRSGGWLQRERGRPGHVRGGRRPWRPGPGRRPASGSIRRSRRVRDRAGRAVPVPRSRRRGTCGVPRVHRRRARSLSQRRTGNRRRPSRRRRTGRGTGTTRFGRPASATEPPGYGRRTAYTSSTTGAAEPSAYTGTAPVCTSPQPAKPSTSPEPRPPTPTSASTSYDRLRGEEILVGV